MTSKSMLRSHPGRSCVMNQQTPELTKAVMLLGETSSASVGLWVSDICRKVRTHGVEYSELKNTRPECF